jgi:thiol-disulfide isomerase/thioredoxin
MTFKKDLICLLKPYYWVNLLLSFSYLIAKRCPIVCSYVAEYLFPQRDEKCELDSRETEILFFLIIVVMIRTRKAGSVTMINYMTSSFIYTKVANVILWFYADTLYGIVFCVIFVLGGLLLPEPTYSGPENIVYFRTNNGMRDELENDKRVNWLIVFYTVWNPACVNFAPIFAQLSAEYHLDNLKFGKIDIGRFPEVGARFNVSGKLPF